MKQGKKTKNPRLKLTIYKNYPKLDYCNYYDQQPSIDSSFTIMIHMSYHISKDFRNSIGKIVIDLLQLEKKHYGHLPKSWKKPEF